jgi:hypothetical protein
MQNRFDSLASWLNGCHWQVHASFILMDLPKFEADSSSGHSAKTLFPPF